MTTTSPSETALDAIARAADEAVSTLATVSALTPAGAQPGDDQVPAVFPRAVVATTVGGAGSVGLLVGEELLVAAESAPGGSLTAAFQPALDAIATALGAQAGAGREVAPADFAAALGSWCVVPLIGEGFAGGVAASEQLLAPAAPAPEPEPAATQTPVVSASTVTHEPSQTMAVTTPQGSNARATGATLSRGIEMLNGVDMELTVELGRTRMLVRDLLALAPGDVVELDRAAGSPADLLVGGRLIARGEVVVVDEDFGLRITHIVEPAAG